MRDVSRREFLEHVGEGMLIAGLGASLAGDLGISAAFADEGDGRLDFGKLRPLVDLLKQTEPDKLQPLLVTKLQNEQVDLQKLIAAAALANAETFGGHDYVGYHTEMALVPALEMAAEMPKGRQALPVLKVLYRNAHRIQQAGGKPALKPIEPAPPAESRSKNPLRDATRAADLERSERILAQQTERSLDEAYNQLLWIIQDDVNVHRFVLAHRAWELTELLGPRHAHTILRQCVRFCIDDEKQIKQKSRPTPIRRLVPKLLDQYKLLAKPLGDRQPDDGWIDEMSQFVYQRPGEEGMDAMAAALAEGISPEAVGEVVSLAANQLVLRQDKLSNGSKRAHGATPGVHTSDATNSWRNIARTANHRNAVVGLLVAAYHTGGHKAYKQEPLPHEPHREAIKKTDAAGLLAEAEAAIRDNDQGRAAAAIQIYGERGFAPRPVFNLMLRYSVSEDGRLHAEKYYRTVTEEFATIRPVFRWRQLVSLARVTASSYGFNVKDKPGHRAPGYEQACRLLGVEA